VEQTAEPQSEEAVTATSLDESYPDAVLVFQQLIVGTILLEETEYGVTAEQAQELLTLWQMFRAIRRGDAPPSLEEIDAILAQIVEAMTPEQLGAIKAMELTQDDVRAFAQANGISGQGGNSSDSQNLSPEERKERMLTQGAKPFVDELIRRLEIWAG
jgi:hypothetical protein